MKLLVLFLAFTFSSLLIAQESDIKTQMDTFLSKHKKAYLYCTENKYESCYPIKEIKFEYDDSMKGTPYMVNNDYSNGKLTIKLNPNITSITLKHELLRNSEKLLDPL